MSGTTLEIIAPTVEEALSQGLAQLGLTADAVSVEVLDSGSKGLFGLGGRQVRVRLTVNPPPGEEVQTPPPARQKPADRPKSKPAPVQKTESAPKAQREQKPRAEKKPVREAPAAPAPEKIRQASDSNDPLLDTTESIVSKLIHYLGMKAQVSAHYDDGSTDDRRIIQVDVRGDDLSALIGRQAETLNAFQYVASLIVGKETEQFVQLTVDVEGYRDRREKQLVQMAKRMADQVAKSGRRQTLEPMPSGERRVIHIALRDHPTVKTESTGEEPYRKVMIVPKED